MPPGSVFTFSSENIALKSGNWWFQSIFSSFATKVINGFHQVAFYFVRIWWILMTDIYLVPTTLLKNGNLVKESWGSFRTTGGNTTKGRGGVGKWPKSRGMGKASSFRSLSLILPHVTCCHSLPKVGFHCPVTCPRK